MKFLAVDTLVVLTQVSAKALPVGISIAQVHQSTARILISDPMPEAVNAPCYLAVYEDTVELFRMRVGMFIKAGKVIHIQTLLRLVPTLAASSSLASDLS
jgi:hypothetical protein